VLLLLFLLLGLILAGGDENGLESDDHLCPSVIVMIEMGMVLFFYCVKKNILAGPAAH